MRIGTDEKLVILGEDNFMTLNLRNLTGEMNSSYMYITDPPVFADVGDFDWDFNDTSLLASLAIYLNSDHVPQVNLGALKLTAAPFAIDLDGVSDLSQVISRLVTYVGNVVRRRLMSISDYLEDTNPEMLEKLANELLLNIPDVIPLDPLLPHVYLEGGLRKSPVVKPNQFVEFELDFSVQDDQHPLTTLNLANFSKT